mgnify:CR=1 FL=1
MNLPNALTILRLALVPVFTCLYFTRHVRLALIVYLAAALTDLLDGYLARRLNQITPFGKLMDPLADKLMQVAMLFCLATSRRIPWAVLVTLAIKELYMIAGSLYMLKKKVVVYANWCGKAATFALVLAILLVYPWHGVAWLDQAGLVVLYAALALSVASAALYTRGAVKQLRQC